MKRLVHARRYRKFREFHQQEIFLIDGVFLRVRWNVLQILKTQMKIATGCQRQPRAHLRLKLIAALANQLRIKVVSGIRVGCSHNVRDSVRDGHFGHLNRFFKILRAIIEPRKNVAMNVYHVSKYDTRTVCGEQSLRKDCIPRPQLDRTLDQPRQFALRYSPAILFAASMSTFFIEQFGCRATQADAAAIERQLRERGYDSAANANAAGVVVINTCTVTAAADLQARQAIHAIHKQNPEARIVVTGCYAQRAPEEIARLDGVTWVVGNSHKAEIPRIVYEMGHEMEEMTATAARLDSSFVPMAALANANSTDGLLSLGRIPAKILIGNILDQEEFIFAPSMAAEGHTRPVLKIQDGCDSHCSYCVIPLVRGRSRSLAPFRVIEEIRRLVDQGAHEVVLSGIDLGSYGQDLTAQDAPSGNASGDTRGHARRGGLAPLLHRILEETSVKQLRISSIEPMDVTADLLALFTEHDRMAQHFHMPLQSGCDRLLAAMHRKYRAEHYARRAEFVRETLPDAAIGADVIAGFPGETEEDHQATLQLVRQLPVTYLHVFSFSSRPGTAAAEMGNQVPAPVIARRARELRALGEKKKRAFYAARMGRTIRILTLNRMSEDSASAWTRAISGNYVDVRVAGRWPANQFLAVEITGVKGGFVEAVLPSGKPANDYRFPRSPSRPD
jgi:threonylcarbamoyladenosine tRNA methylthiotransferase MtaB